MPRLKKQPEDMKRKKSKLDMRRKREMKLIERRRSEGALISANADAVQTGEMPRLKKKSHDQRKRENKIRQDRKREAALSSANSNAVQKGKSITIEVKTDNDNSKKQESECEDGEDIMEDCSKICTPLDVGDKDQNLQKKKLRMKIERVDYSPRGNKVRERAREEYAEVYAKEREEFEEYAAKVAAEIEAQIAERAARIAKRAARKAENAARVAALKDANTAVGFVYKTEAPQTGIIIGMTKKNLAEWRKKQKILKMEKIANDALQAEKMERKKKYYLTKWRKEQEIHKIAKISSNDAVQSETVFPKEEEEYEPGALKSLSVAFLRTNLQKLEEAMDAFIETDPRLIRSFQVKEMMEATLQPYRELYNEKRIIEMRKQARKSRRATFIASHASTST